jgi:antitoxin component HigA of HigAB toxin-antitoxin module
MNKLAVIPEDKSRWSRNVSGKRRPSKTQIKKLAEFFGVAPEVFISLY